MAISGPGSYSQWINENPETMQAVQQRMGGQAVGQQQQGGVQPVAQATDSEKVPMLKQQQAPAQQQQQQGVNTANGSEVGGRLSGSDTEDHGADGVKRVASLIASFWTGGAASGLQGLATGGSSDPRTQQTMTEDAKATQGGGNFFGSLMSGIGSIGGMVGGAKGGGGGKGGGFGGFGGK